MGVPNNTPVDRTFANSHEEVDLEHVTAGQEHNFGNGNPTVNLGSSALNSVTMSTCAQLSTQL